MQSETKGVYPDNIGTPLEEKEIKPIDILLVDDSEDDIIIIKRVFKKIHLENCLYVVRSGEEAMDFISHQGKYAEGKPPTPGLILLDISMPGMSGFDVLEKIKTDPKYRIIPIIMLTTSNREQDIVKSYKNGACSYITKPVEFIQFVEVIQCFELYWTLVSKVPKVK